MHFTSTKEALYGIISEGFRLKHCRESFVLGDVPVQLHIPMVSFCDIPLSQIALHAGNYGCYGIGLSKSWALRHKLNPVLYIQQQSHLAEGYYGMVSDLYDRESSGEADKNPRRVAMNIARYMKNYEGRLELKGEVRERYRFSDEREWRYVPPLSDKVDMMYTSEEFERVGKLRADELLAGERLQFELDDIRCLVIKDEDEIVELVSHIMSANGDKGTMAQVHRVITRILTFDQISSDV